MTLDDATAMRMLLLNGGYSPIPLVGKIPAIKAWQTHISSNPDEIELWRKLYPDATNTGVLTRRNPTADIDLLNEEAAEAVEERLRMRFEHRGLILTRIGQAPKRAIIFRCEVPFPKMTRNLVAGNGAREKIEILCDGQQVVVFGIHPDTRAPYLWHGGDPSTVRPEELPLVHPEELAAFLDDAVALLVRDYGYKAAIERPKTNGRHQDSSDSSVLSQDNLVLSRGPEDWEWLVANIVSGTELHDSCTSLAMKLIKGGMNGGATVNFLRALHNASCAPRDARWQERFADIPRAVASAEAKHRPAPARNGGGSPQPELQFQHLYQPPEDGAMQTDWLIEKLLPARGIVILSGWPGVGKTHIVNDLMCSVATGMPFAGHAVARSCGAVLFAAEGGNSIHARWQVLRHAKTGPWFESQGLPADTPFPASFTDRVPYLNDEQAFEQYDAALTEVARVQAERMAAAGVAYDGLGLVGFDTYNAALSFGDEQHNKVGPNQAVFNMAHRLADKHNCCIVMVDHLGKDASKGPLGTIAKSASCDVDLRVTGTVGDDGSVSNTAMTVHKLRAGAQGLRLPFELRTVRLSDGQEGKTVQWDASGLGMRVVKQNKRHALLMRALDEAIGEKWQWVSLGENLNFKAADSRLVRGQFELSYPPTSADGDRRQDTIRKAFDRAMKDSSIAGVIGSKTLSDKSVVIWRTDYKFADSSEVSEVSEGG